MDEIEELARQRVGTVLRDRYRVEALLGMGGMAAVYRGSHRNGNRVAIKMLHPDLAKSKEICSRFLKEGYVANTVDHPGAVRVLDDDTSADGAPFIVMELLEGQTVDARVEACGGVLDVHEAAVITHALLDVLVVAHAKGIVHRDLKPENLFLTKTNELKVLDFGIARMRDGVGTSWTRSGHAMGTPAYMPPEQAMGLVRDIDGRTDLWAVGATMFRLLTGRFVHEAETVQQLLIFAATQPARPIRKVRPEIPSAFAALVDRVLRYEKTERFADAAAMRAALEEAHEVELHAPIPGAATRRPLVARDSGDTKVDNLGLHELPTKRGGSILEVPAPSNVPSLGVALAPTVDAAPRMPAPANQSVLAPTVQAAKPLAQPTVAAEEHRAAPVVAVAMPGRAASTTAGLSSGHMDRVTEPGTSAPRSRTRLVLAMALGGIVSGGVIAAGIIGISRGLPSAAGSSSTTEAIGIVEAAAPPVASVATPSPPLPSASVASTIPVVVSASVAPAAPPPLPVLRPAAAPCATPAKTAPVPSAASAAPVPAAAPASAPAKPLCDPPWFYGEDGHRHIRPGCETK